MLINKSFIFFRDDDVFKLDRSFSKISSLFLKHRVPVIYGVIPGKMQPELIKYLGSLKKMYPMLLDISQHGWMHINHSDNKKIKYEFGSGRSNAEQKNDILSGWIAMRKAFGEDFTPLFIPPFHGYDESTKRLFNLLANRKIISAVSAEKKLFLSSDKYFIDLPASINFKRKLTGKSNSIQDILAKIAEASRHTSVIGILMHHETYSKRDYERLKKLILILKKNSNFRFILPSKLLPPKKNVRIDLSIEITNQCNLRCKLCNIWKERRQNSISLYQFKHIFSRILEYYSIGSVAITGGEPFLHPQINEIYTFLHNLKSSGKIQEIGIYTNGYSSRIVENFLKKNAGIISGLRIGISIDGTRKTHNILRGKNDAFQKSTRLLMRMRKKYPTASTVAKFTISPLNFQDLPKIYSFCKKSGIPLLSKLYENKCIYYYHKEGGSIQGDKGFSSSQKQALSTILRRLIDASDSHSERKIFEILGKTVSNGSIPVNKCYTPLFSLFITAEGTIHPCLYQEPIANINDDSWANSLLKQKHMEIIVNGITMHCPRCLAYHGILRSINI